MSFSIKIVVGLISWTYSSRSLEGNFYPSHNSFARIFKLVPKFRDSDSKNSVDSTRLFRHDGCQKFPYVRSRNMPNYTTCMFDLKAFLGLTLKMHFSIKKAGVCAEKVFTITTFVSPLNTRLPLRYHIKGSVLISSRL